MPKLKPRRPNVLQKRQLQAYHAGQDEAIRVAVPLLEQRLRQRMTARVWVGLYAAWGLGMALGAALGVAWERSGIQGGF